MTFPLDDDVAELTPVRVVRMAEPCCDFHGRTCEPPSELCCYDCTEGAHPAHADGSACSAPDLSGFRA